jgi:ATP-binding cassette subfamily B protein
MMRPDKFKQRPMLPFRLQIQVLKRIFSYITSAYRLRLGLVLISIVFSVLAGVAGSLFLKILIDDHIMPLSRADHPDFSSLITAIMTMAGIYAVGVTGTMIYARLMAGIAQNVLKQLRDSMFSHMQSLPVSFFDTHSHGDLMSRFTNDTDSLRQLLAQSLPQVVASIITLTAVFAAMVATSIHLTLIVIFFLVLMLLISRKVAGKSADHFTSQQKSLGETNGYVEEMISGEKVIKVFNYEQRAKQRFDRLNDVLAKHSEKAHRFANILMPIMGNIGHLQYVVIAVTGGLLSISGVGGITIGAIASFLQLSRTFTMPVMQISQQVNAIALSLAGAKRIFDLLDQEPESDEGTTSLVRDPQTGSWMWEVANRDGSRSVRNTLGEISLSGVTFSYDGKQEVLHDISLTARAGQKIALVGATGAGKTTITNLINRFYDITSGNIAIDGIPVREIKKMDLRRSLSLVLQDTALFTGTVMDNIRYGRLEATDEQVIEAARRSSADAFIMMLPDGYDTMLSGTDSGLSQGQRQLLSIARAEIADTPVMILDEATSSIDTHTEAIVQRGMDTLMEGRTVLVIAHRLSTVQNADLIMVLEHGRIIEQGNHRQLLDKKGRYYQLYTGMFELD